jgi:hypothetical protein
MSQSFHAGIATTAHRRRTDLMPTITSSVAPSHAGTRNSSRMDGSRSSTPGNKMLRSANPGRTVSMSRLEVVSKPRVLVPNPHASNNTTATTTTPRKPRSPPSASKRASSMSVSMVQLNGPNPVTSRRTSDDQSRALKTPSFSNRAGKFCTGHKLGDSWWRLNCYTADPYTHKHFSSSFTFLFSLFMLHSSLLLQQIITQKYIGTNDYFLVNLPCKPFR